MKDTISSKENQILTYSNEEIISSLLITASELNYSFACWRLPKDENIHLLVDFSENSKKVKPFIEQLPKGFLIQPFLKENEESTLFLNADFIFSTETKNIELESSLSNSPVLDQFIEKALSNLKTGNKNFHLQEGGKIQFNKASDHYLNIVEKAKVEIQNDVFKKVVLARKKEIPLQNNVDICSVYQNILTDYPNAFVSLINTKEYGTWLTATPEVLVKLDSKGVFSTVALAGTQSLKEFENLNRAVWTQKEIEEQALVSRYIVNCFKKIRLREYEENGPRTIRSANLLHLQTEYSVNTKEVNFPELGSVMLELLHPTSAVCGMPKETAIDFISENEQLNRELFSGYVGPVNVNEATQLFVNLRCASIYSNKAVLYAGAGITQDSEAEKEYLETEMKMDTIGRFLIK